MLYSFTASSIVTVIVGKEQRIYKLHRNLLVKKSPFFAKCLNSGMLEQQREEIVLPEDSSRAFDFIADWVYYEKVREVKGNEGAEERIRAYVLADKYCMPELQNALLDNLAGFWQQKSMNPNRMKLIAELTNENCPLYKLMFAELAYDLANHPHWYRRASDIGDEDQNSNATRRPMAGWPETIDELLAHPGLSSKLMWKVAGTEKGGPSPTDSPEKYHVPVEPKPENQEHKRKAEEQDDGRESGAKQPRK